MRIADKYEPVADSGGHHRAKHRRLGREVAIYRFPKDEARNDNLRSVASRLGKLDHLQIPHLIDFLELPNEYALILESHSTKQCNLLDAGELLDRLVVLEQIVDALAHVSRHGLAHGDFSVSSLILDTQGHAKLTGIGIRQCAGQEPDHVLHGRDRANLRSIVHDLLSRAPEDEESSRRQDELTRLVDREDQDIRVLSDAFRKWLDRELSLREAKKLEFDSKSIQLAPQKHRHVLLVACCVGIGMLAVSLLALAMWPTKSAPNTNLSGTHHPHTTQQQLAAAKGSSSNLDPVASLNTAIANESRTTDELEVDNIPDTAATINSDDEDESKGSTPEMEESEPSTKPEPIPPATRTNSPFPESPKSIDLPAPDHPTSTILLSTDLTGDERLELELLGGAGAFKSGVFRLQAESDEQAWDVLFSDDGENRTIARVKVTDGQIHFAWSNRAANVKSNTYLRNAMLVFRSGKWSHELALRQPARNPAIAVDLSPKLQLELNIDHPPAQDTVFIEFIPSTESLASALPQSVMRAAGDRMMIGLDAGKNSLVILQLESTSRGRLRSTGWARQTKSATRLQIKNGFERRIRLDLQMLNKQLFAMKTGLKSIRGKDATERRKQVQTKIKRLEQSKEIADAFWQSYQAAVATKLNFKIYRQLAERRLVLAEFGNSATDESDPR